MRGTRRLSFRDEWRRFEFMDYASTLAIAAAYAYVEFFVDFPKKPRWTGPVLFDSGARDALVGRSSASRNRAAVISDVLYYVPLAAPFVESALVPLLFDDGNTDVAWQLSAMNLQAAAVTALLTRAGHRFVARERPDTRPCRRNLEYDERCFAGAYASFPSGHSSAAFLGAGLACAHHANLPLYGGGLPDVLVCVGATAMATGNSVARIVADRHYASDVFVGAALGAATGFGMPILLHYGGIGSFRASSRTAAGDLFVVPVLSLEIVGTVATGRF